MSSRKANGLSIFVELDLLGEADERDVICSRSLKMSRTRTKFEITRFYLHTAIYVSGALPAAEFGLDDHVRDIHIFRSIKNGRIRILLILGLSFNKYMHTWQV